MTWTQQGPSASAAKDLLERLQFRAVSPVMKGAQNVMDQERTNASTVIEGSGFQERAATNALLHSVGTSPLICAS